MATNSPAPWSARKNLVDGSAGSYTIEDADGIAIALVFDVGETTEANAQLIATAPDAQVSA